MFQPFTTYLMASVFFRSTIPCGRVDILRHALSDKSAPYGECVVWTGPTDKYGYGIHRVIVGGKRLKLLVHRLAYFIEKSPIELSPCIHVSHLCHNKLCINLDHLSYESNSVNNARKVCQANGECTGHRGFRRCIFCGETVKNCYVGLIRCCCCLLMLVTADETAVKISFSNLFYDDRP